MCVNLNRCAQFESGLWVPIETLIAKAPDALLRYLYELPVLLAALCAGRNYNGIHALRDLWPYHVLFALLRTEAIPHGLRARFATLLLALHVDCDPMEALQLPRCTRVWAEVRGGASGLACASPECIKRLDALRDWVSSYFTSLRGQQSASDPSGKNELTLEVLKIAKAMLRFGVYPDVSRIRALMKPIFALLDSVDDVASARGGGAAPIAAAPKGSPGKGIDAVFAASVPPPVAPGDEERYTVTEETSTIIACKVLMCEILLVLADFRVDARLTRFLGAFKDRGKNGGAGAGGSTVGATARGRPKRNAVVPHIRERDVGYQGAGAADGGDGAGADEVALFEGVFGRVANDLSLDMETMHTRNAIAVLMDLTLYKHAGLVAAAYELVTRSQNQMYEMLRVLDRVQLLVRDDAVARYAAVVADVGALRKLAETSELWLSAETDAARASAIAALQILDRLALVACAAPMPDTYGAPVPGATSATAAAGRAGADAYPAGVGPPPPVAIPSSSTTDIPPLMALRPALWPSRLPPPVASPLERPTRR